MSDIIEVKENASLRQNGKIPIVIPCDVSEFGDFITNLLSKPQTLKGEIEGVFNITPKNISNVYHLIDQRITKQNDAQLVHFEIKVVYDNGASVTHKKVEDFEKYYPIDNGFPSEVVLSFYYLIKFKDKEVPEKQEINFVFSANPNQNRERNKWYTSGLIEWNISHTERTWASDINGLLKTHAKNCMNKRSGFWSWLVKYYDEIMHYLGGIVICIAAVLWGTSTFGYLAKEPNIVAMAKYYTGSAIVFTVMYFSILIVSRLVAMQLIVRKESFICLVDKDFEEKTKRRKKATWRLGLYFLSLILNVAIGVIANMVYNSSWLQA